MRHFLLPACVLLTLPLAGCGYEGPETGEVSGTVTIDGKPISGIHVNFTPVEGGRPSSGTTDDKGHYVLAYSPSALGALPGKHTVSITPPEPSIDLEGASSAPLVNDAIPRKYLNMKKQVEVKLGENTIDLTYP